MPQYSRHIRACKVLCTTVPGTAFTQGYACPFLQAIRPRRPRSLAPATAQGNKKVRSTMHIVRQTRFLFCAATLLFTASAMLAQTSSATQTAKQTTTQRESYSGMATGRRMHKPISTASQKSLGSAHATESSTVQPATASATQRGNMDNAQSNPLYKEKPTSGENPLYESKDKTAQPVQHSGKASHEVVEYKDGEDQQTRGKKQAADRKSGSVIVLDHEGSGTFARKSGSVIVLDREDKAKSAAKRSQPHSTGTTAKQ